MVILGVMGHPVDCAGLGIHEAGVLTGPSGRLGFWYEAKHGQARIRGSADCHCRSTCTCELPRMSYVPRKIGRVPNRRVVPSALTLFSEI